jgi:amino acid transporter
MSEMDLSASQSPSGFYRTLGRWDVALFSISAILVVDTLTSAASIGPAAISWWLITLVLFFVPYGLITAELGSAYPRQGGIFIWIRQAFGDQWGARAAWYYWFNNALWIPTTYLAFANIFSRLFFPDMQLFDLILVSNVMTWLTVGLTIISMRVGKWLPNLGAFLKIAIMAVIGIGAFIFAQRNGVANDLSLGAILPRLDAGLAFLPIILFNLLGFELVSGAGEEMKNPRRHLPGAIIASGALVTVFYMVGTLGVLMAIPTDRLGLLSGVMDTLQVVLGEGAVGTTLFTGLGIATLITVLVTAVTWTMGTNRVVAEAAAEGLLPSFLGELNPRNRTPLGATIITGLISTLVLLIYGFLAQSNEDLFWTMLAFSTVVLLLPYLALFPAFLKLRQVDPDTPRPFRFPGSNLFARIAAIVCEAFILLGIVLFFWTPGEPFDWSFALPVLIGLLVAILLGELFIWAGRRGRQSELEEEEL